MRKNIGFFQSADEVFFNINNSVKTIERKVRQAKLLNVSITYLRVLPSVVF